MCINHFGKMNKPACRFLPLLRNDESLEHKQKLTTINTITTKVDTTIGSTI